MATKHALVYEDGSVLVVAPPVVTLKGGADGIQFFNETDVTVVWRVPPGPFSHPGPFEKEIKPGRPSPVVPARRLGRQERFSYTVIEQRLRPGKKRCRRARAKSDPVIIIDL